MHTLEQIAATAHEANRSLCVAFDDFDHPNWREASVEQQESVLAGVQFLRDNPKAGPLDSHASWMKRKLATGWTHGPEKDEEKKTHPCLVPFNELPEIQQAKDYVFVAIVRSMLNPAERVRRMGKREGIAEKG